jgi:hypothetical protein
MMMDDDTFNKVMRGLKGTTGDSNAKRAEQDKRRAKGEDQAANDRKRRDAQKKAKDRRRGDDGVIDTGMFGS